MNAMFRWWVVSVCAAALALVASAQPADPPPGRDGWCVTSPSLTADLRARHESNRRGIRLQGGAESRLNTIEGMFVVEADEANLVNRSQFDLAGSALSYVPGTPAAIEIVESSLSGRGALVADFASSSQTHATVDLPFVFPFGGRSHGQVHLTSRNSIHFDPPALGAVEQYDDLDLAAIEEPLISPLLLGAFPRTFIPPRVYADVNDDRVVVTWVADSPDFGYEVQAVLHEDGAIRLDWGAMRSVDWGGVVVTPGLDAAGLARELILELSDPTFDTTSPRSDLDLETVTLERLGATDVLALELDLRGVVRQGSIPEGKYVQYGIDAGNGARVTVHLTHDERYVHFPDRGWVRDPGSLKIEGDTIRFLLRDFHLPAGPVAVNAWIWDGDLQVTTDTARANFEHRHSTDRFDLDLSEVESRPLARPLIEAFTLGDLNPYRVWEQLRSAYGLAAEEVDALAMYQTMYTDLVLYAGAYSTVGNPGADGVSSRSGYGQRSPKFPALLHMSKLGYRYNAHEDSALHVLNHEFGHRWLYFFDLLEQGERTNSLNPLGGHPAQYVHTPAAFDVRGTRNSSAMGGWWFDDLGDGRFRAREEPGAYGFSWHELYLMGLARADEVEPWFYIRNSQPELGGAYYPPAGIVVSGERRDVTVEQLTAAMGPRSPGAETSRKRFVTYFVLLVDDLDAVTPEDLADLDHKRRLLQSSIPAATGGRASVQTLFGETYPRRRITRRP